MAPAYDPAAIEAKWQQRWAERNLYRTPDANDGRENFMLLVEFPYPSGNLHIGHWYAFALPDMHARYLRMRGHNVTYPIGFDAFGLPAENAAIQHDTNPRDWTERNIETMSEQLRSMGASFDWSRQVATIDPAYYQWTQWLFIQLFQNDLAYRAKTRVNWCPTDKTVLANEQVIDGKCERDGSVVEQREIEQWMLKTTAFARELTEGLEDLDWPTSTKIAQHNWIGPSEGADIVFSLAHDAPVERLTVFTTRPDTLFGATFVVISPELAQRWMDDGWDASSEVRTYVTTSLGRRELDRLEQERTKTGVATGIDAINPVNQEHVPVWVADYVLGSYGSGAIMAVPAHDERDFAFAQAFGIPVRQVIQPQANGETGDVAYTGEGILINSGPYTDMASPDARERITSALQKEGLAEAKTTYRLRDWILSRQRYWGCPIPLIRCKGCGYVPVPDDQLPVVLPPLDDYKPADDGRSPLAKVTDWVRVPCPSCGKDAERETDTMDTFVDSSWYFLRYTDPNNTTRFADADKINAWMPVPMYLGGAEHNTMHLLYSRFWTRAMHHMGLLPFAEPFLGRRNRGIILGADGMKMSKSRGNVVDPDELVTRFGADTVRLYLAFMAPYEQGGPWDPNGINGVHRFLKRFWVFVQEHAADKGEDSDDARRAVHRATKEIGSDLEHLRLNTTVSWAMKMLNALEREAHVSSALLAQAVTVLAPMAPHIADELWSEVLGREGSVHEQAWPSYDEELLEEATIELPVQVNGKVRGSVTAQRSDDQERLVELAHQEPSIARHLDGKNLTKVIFVPGRMLNLIVG